MLKFAANLSFLFTELPFPQRFKAASQAGFTGVEFLFPYDYQPEEIVEFLQNAQLELALHNLPPGDWSAGDRGIAALAGRQKEFRASLDTALQYAKATGLKRLHVMAGCVSEQDRAAAHELYIENVTYAAGILADEGITALIEPINTIDMPGYYLNHAEQAIDLIQTIGAANIRLQYDCYHREIMGGDTIAGLENYFPMIGHIQIASVPDRHEPDHGDCDYQAVFATLERLGYDGWIGCEYRPRSTTEDGLDWRYFD